MLFFQLQTIRIYQINQKTELLELQLSVLFISTRIKINTYQYFEMFQLLKFRFSLKVTLIWSYLPLTFDITY